MTLDDISDGDWKLILRAQSEVATYLARVSRLPSEIVSDCVSDGLVDFLVEYDPVEIATTANAMYVEKHTIIHARLREAAEKRLGKERRRIAKTVSDDTPIGEEDGDLHLRDLFIPRINTAERVENYAEWMMFARRGGCPLSKEEINELFGFN